MLRYDKALRTRVHNACLRGWRNSMLFIFLFCLGGGGGFPSGGEDRGIGKPVFSVASY